MPLSIGYRITWAGEFEDLPAATTRLDVVVAISLVLILALLYGLFNSVRATLWPWPGIHRQLSAGIVALYPSDLDFSVSAAIGAYRYLECRSRMASL